MKKKTSNAIKLHTESGKPCTESTGMKNDIQRKHNSEIPTFLLDFQVKLQEKTDYYIMFNGSVQQEDIMT